MRALVVLLAGTAALAWAAGESQPYTLEYPGVVFEWLPSQLASPVAGTLDEESGSVASPATTDGSEYHFCYWKEDIPLGEARETWMETRLPSVLPAGFGDHLQLGDLNWTEGSQLSEYRNSRSLGLVLMVNFNVIDEAGSVLGRGRAYGAFREGYSLLLYCIAPTEASFDAVANLDGIIATAHLE
jgi:hypothetical protein